MDYRGVLSAVRAGIQDIQSRYPVGVGPGVWETNPAWKALREAEQWMVKKGETRTIVEVTTGDLRGWRYLINGHLPSYMEAWAKAAVDGINAYLGEEWDAGKEQWVCQKPLLPTVCGEGCRADSGRPHHRDCPNPRKQQEGHLAK